MVNWINNYFLILKLQFLRMKTTLPFFCILQIMIGIGASIGISYYVPVRTPEVTAYIATGVPTITLLTIGMTLLPQSIASDRDKGIIDYIWTLPVSRVCYLLADLSVWVVTCIPGIIISLLFGANHYNLNYDYSFELIFVYLLTALCSCLFGYAIANLFSNSQIVLLICNFLIFSLFLFSPIAYSIEQLPKWLQKVHEFLPIIYMADMIRDTLLDVGKYEMSKSYSVVLIWTVLCFIITVKVMYRKK